MIELVRANVVANLAYYRRSRLLLAFLLVFLLITGLQSLPPLFAHSAVQSFNALQEIFSDLSGFLLLLSAGFGLFIMASHLRSRSLKMVFTKPCSPAVWLGSAFLSAVMVSLLLTAAMLGSVLLLSWLWHVPVRAGLVYVSLDAGIASLGIIAYLMLLATVLHPAVAVVVALIFNAELFYSVQLWALAVVRSGSSNWGLRMLAHIARFFYLASPIVHPFGKETREVYSSLRVGHGDWKYLLYGLGYGLIFSAFCYSVALFALQRKRHI